MTDDNNLNQVRLIGKLAGEPVMRELPSGDTVWTLRVVVERPATTPDQTQPVVRPRQRVDSIECAAWTPSLGRQIKAYHGGDTIHIEGSLRRRFFRAGGATASRMEVEIETIRVVEREKREDEGDPGEENDATIETRTAFDLLHPEDEGWKRSDLLP